MATSGPKYPGTVASLANAGTSENANGWTSPGNVSADDGTEASITAATYDSPDISELLVASNFNFAADIPSGATINGITVEIDRRDQAIGAASDNRVQLSTSTAFAGLVGTNKADTATDWPTASAIATYGGSADTWSASLTADQVRDTGFAVMLSVQADAANTDIFVDFLRVTIDYTVTHTATGSVSVPAATVAGTGVMHPSGTGAISVPAATTSGTGAETFTATGAVSVPAATTSGTGAETFTATGAVTVPAATTSGTGDHTESAPTATGAVSVPAPTVTGTGALTFTATGAITAPAATFDGTGAQAFTATGALSAPAATVGGTGTHLENVTGTGAITAPAATVAGVGTGGADPSTSPYASAAALARGAHAAAQLLLEAEDDDLFLFEVH